MATARDFIAILDRTALRLEEDPANECFLCNAWLPHPHALAEAAGYSGIVGARCPGCGATYVIQSSGAGARILTDEDAENPYLAALYARRYGAVPAGWCEPPGVPAARGPLVARVGSRDQVRRLLRRQRGSLSEGETRRLAGCVAERAGVSIPHAGRLLREELAAGPKDVRRPHLLPVEAAAPAAAAEQEA